MILYVRVACLVTSRGEIFWALGEQDMRYSNIKLLCYSRIMSTIGDGRVGV